MLRIYNTMSRKKEEFKPLHDGIVNMYVCGPTTYDLCHVGHARSYVAFDVIRRYLEYKGYYVKYVVNFTDIDDKIIKRASEIGEDPLKLSQRYVEEALKDFEKLGIRRADIHPRVTKHIDDIIKAVRKLVSLGYAYVSDGDVYFDVSKFKDYGKLSHLNMQDAKQEPNPKKKNPQDFALWKKAKPGEPSWDSPWGPGRPGWHIECSVMSTKYLGSTLDIHGGGRDLIFPHHENEIAQSESLTGKKFVRYWMHNGFVTINKEKMSKSLGNFFTIRDILKKYDGEVIRLFLLSTHYRSEIDFSEKSLDEASEKMKRLYNVMERLRVSSTNEDNGFADENNQKLFDKVDEYRRKFLDFMDDDFNTAGAISVMFEMARDVNKFMDENDIYPGIANKIFLQFLEFGKILNVFWKYKRKSDDDIPKLMNFICKIRDDIRKKKMYEISDEIRDDIQNLGYKIEDSSKGSVWKKM